MVTKVTLCNLALSHLGASATLEDLTEDSPAARECNLWYDETRKQVLAADDWDFARRKIVLSIHSVASDAKFMYRYQYPADAIKILRIEHDVDEIPPRFEPDTAVDALNVASRSILTNKANAVGVYTRDEENTALFDPRFIDAFAYALAIKMVNALTDDEGILESLTASYLIALQIQQTDDGFSRAGRQEQEPLAQADSTGQVEIGNMALGVLGVPPSVTSFTDTTKEAQDVAFWYPKALKYMLSTYQYPFATQRIALTGQVDISALATGSEDVVEEAGWAFRYTYPATALHIWEIQRVEVGDASPLVYHKVELDADGNKTVLTNVDDAVAICSIDPGTDKFSEQFKYALATRIAYNMAGNYLRKASDITAIYQIYLLALSPAQGIIEDVNLSIVQARHITGRHG